ncbi:hypothetical protein KIPB_009644 [Kipferlia bialata]|uniref:Uncharacterized protein n=1 Tax=Kipferlia bialata TaxID=797122 RepID=A0A9K3D452_9EUKA|nr:hypothetical protein KIPB_009644 [Kipferlia bialata]|eukprot:g9644.t1
MQYKGVSVAMDIDIYRGRGRGRGRDMEKRMGLMSLPFPAVCGDMPNIRHTYIEGAVAKGANDAGDTHVEHGILHSP